MSHLCRLKNRSYGEDGLWAYNEIVRLREENAKLKEDRDARLNQAAEAALRMRQAQAEVRELRALKARLDEVERELKQHPWKELG